MSSPKEKIRLKFRVSAFEGAGATEPKWTEKWGVGLFSFEEFHVTDQLLKLPFQETPPKTVCTFSVAETLLRFRLLDPDRTATVNGLPKKEGLLVVGDRIRIGETLSIEVLLAPGKPPVRASAVSSAMQADGPTLIFTEGSLEAPPEVGVKEPAFQAGKLDMPEIHEPSVQTRLAMPTLSETSAAHSPRPESSSMPFEATLETVRPDLAPKLEPNARHPFFMPEPKVELANVPHAVRDSSLDGQREKEFEEEKESVKPVYTENADLESRLTFAEKILSVVAKVMRRDDLNPPSEKFPLDQETFRSNSGSAKPIPVKPWNPRAETANPSHRTKDTVLNGETTGGRPDLKPWTPAPESRGTRLRTRALVFLVAAAGALMIAVGVFRVYSKVHQEQEAKKIEAGLFQYQRGVPLKHIEEKVRRMRRSR